MEERHLVTFVLEEEATGINKARVPIGDNLFGSGVFVE